MDMAYFLGPTNMSEMELLSKKGTAMAERSFALLCSHATIDLFVAGSISLSLSLSLFLRLQESLDIFSLFFP
jgi:hypothetical protein